MSFDVKLQNGSPVIGPAGDLELVRGSTKLAQDAVKIMVTPLGSNPTQRWYGSALQSELGKFGLTPEMANLDISQTVDYALRNLKQLQEMQSRTGQPMQPEEQIAAILSVDILRPPADPRSVYIQVRLLTKAGTTVEDQIVAAI